MYTIVTPKLEVMVNLNLQKPPVLPITQISLLHTMVSKVCKGTHKWIVWQKNVKLFLQRLRS